MSLFLLWFTAVLCHRSISPTSFPSCAPRAQAPSFFVRTLDGGATVRSPNCDLRGSSVTCANHGGTAKRLVRMLQRSLDPATVFYGASGPIERYGRYGHRTSSADRLYGHYGAGVTAGSMLAPDWLPQPGPSEQWTSQGEGEDEQGTEQGRGLFPLHAILIFLAAIAPGPGPFRAAPVLQLLTADVAPPWQSLAQPPKKKKQSKRCNKEKLPRQTKFRACRTTSKLHKLYCDRRGGGRIARTSRHVCRSPSSTGISGQMDRLTILGTCMKTRSSGSSSSSSSSTSLLSTETSACDFPTGHPISEIPSSEISNLQPGRGWRMKPAFCTPGTLRC